jgi:hypothetical protein
VRDQILVLEWRRLCSCTVTCSLNMRHSNMALFVLRRQESRQQREIRHVAWKQWLIRPNLFTTSFVQLVVQLPLPCLIFLLPSWLFFAMLRYFFFMENRFHHLTFIMDSFVLICTGISVMKLLFSVLQKFGPLWIVLLLEAWSRNRQCDCVRVMISVRY